MILVGDCLDALRAMPSESVDAVVTDPPYGLGKPPPAADVLRAWLDGATYRATGGGFMGASWDAFVPGPDVWREVARVLKPGGHAVIFAGSRTLDWMGMSVRLGGLEIRDTLGWVYWTGFPKSCDVSKQLDEQAMRHWLNVCKAIDLLDQSAILEGWKIQSEPAPSAAPATFRKRKASFAPVPVLPPLGADGSPASAPTAESRSSGHHLTIAVSSPFVPSPAGVSFTASSDPATTAESRPASLARTLGTVGSSVPCDAWGSLDASTAAKLKGAEALLIWLGSAPFLKQAAFDALIAALADDWKRIMSSPSGLTPNSGTSSATGFASATIATTTGFTAENLISFTVATARSEAERRAAGAEREVVGEHRRHGGGSAVSGSMTGPLGTASVLPLTAPATDAARRWSGWGTALKPAIEPAILARKPFPGTVAANVQRHGTGAINVDGCRLVPGDLAWPGPGDDSERGRNSSGGEWIEGASTFAIRPRSAEHFRAGCGRWPANLYACPKASRAERERGCDGLPARSGADAVHREEGSAGMQSPRAGAGRRREEVRNHHPTVKPVRLMRWLCRLVTPPGGLVVDPFAGSGSTGVAAVLEGFAFVGCELDEGHAAIARARIGHAKTSPGEWGDTAPGGKRKKAAKVAKVRKVKVKAESHPTLFGW